MCSQFKAHTDNRRFGLALSYISNWVSNHISADVSVYGREWVVGTWGCFTRNVHLNVEFFPPSCGVLFAKGGGEGGDGGVAVWEQLVCDPPMWPACCWERWQLLRSRSPRQRWLLWSRSSWRWFGLSVGVWGGVVRYVHGDHRQMHWALWCPPPLTKGTDPEVCFSNMPECKNLVRATFWECEAKERSVNKCETC